jgi:hypothetical protein
MKSITRRLQQLERSASSQRNDEGETPADVLRDRIRRLAVAEGAPFALPQLGRLTDDRGRVLSVMEILRRR